MFFIPIASIALLVWFVVHCINLYHASDYDTKTNAVNNRLRYLMQNYSDYNMQSKIEREHEKQYELNKDVVSDFMGGDPGWRDFTGEYLSEVLATQVILAQHGLIDTRFLTMMYIVHNWIAEPELAADMNAQFVLAIQQELWKHGVHVVAMFQNRFDNNLNIQKSLKEYIAENGVSGIYPTARFWFQ